MKVIRFESYLSLLARGIGELGGQIEEIAEDLETINPGQMKQASRMIKEKIILERKMTGLNDLFNKAENHGGTIFLASETVDQIENAGIIL